MVKSKLFTFKNKMILFTLILFIPVLIFYTCKKLLEKEMMVVTGSVSNITFNSVTVSGTIIDTGTGAKEYGHCYGKQSGVTIDNSKTHFYKPFYNQNFVSELTNLEPGAEYYVKAYIKDDQKIIYGKEISFTTSSGVSDIDGNLYNTVTIGTQEWLRENLKTTRYNDGTPIPLITDDTAWGNLTTPGYCWYYNDKDTYGNTYGALYNWYAVSTSTNGNKNICLTGWHVPTDAEWTSLINYLGGKSIAGNKLKEAGTDHWASPNAYVTNETEFTALPGSCRSYYGSFDIIGIYGFWWSATEIDSSYAWSQRMLNYDSGVFRYDDFKTEGFSVRCVKD